MHQPKQSNDTPQSEHADVKRFLSKTLHPLSVIKKPGVPDSVLSEYHATVMPLDFTTGAPRNAPALLRLMDRAAVRRAIDEIKPWIYSHKPTGYYDYKPTLDSFKDEPYYHHRNARWFADTVHVYLDTNQDGKSSDTLQGRTSWKYGGGEGTDRWLHNYDDDYTWTFGSVFINLLPSKPHQTCPDPLKPHVIYHVIDSTLWKSGTLRMSEFKAILFIAAANKLKPAYKALDHFAVTVLSFWNWEVRIVQGLVNFKTHNVDIRVSPVESFRDGFRNDDGTIDPRFLTLLAYNFAEVLPLAK
ncbi:hypothetical protein MY11210_003823 [Beauveria gryllotalpidicola]